MSDASLLFPLPKMATWHKPTALASGRKLAELAPQKIVFGHGHAIVGNAAQRLREAVAHAQAHQG